MPRVARLSRQLQAEVARMYSLYREAVPAEEREKTSFDDWVASLARKPGKSAVGCAVAQAVGEPAG